MYIRRAGKNEAGTLTRIAFAAKRHWGYAEHWMQQWQAALTVTPDYLAENPTFVAVIAGQIVGFGAIHVESAEAVLDHLWVLPQYMGKGAGRALFRHAEEIARARGCRRMTVVGDPHAEQFYARMGARTYGRQPASMDEKERSLPLLEKLL